MEFWFNNWQHVLKGDYKWQNKIYWAEKMRKTIGKSRHGMITQLFSIQSKPTPTSFENRNPNILDILSKFEVVFTKPHGLHPWWSHDHMIPLKPEIHSIKVQPYYYPYAQKNEIEKIVKEMLLVGIIRLSVSPFSSLVLLV